MGRGVLAQSRELRDPECWGLVGHIIPFLAPFASFLCVPVPSLGCPMCFWTPLFLFPLSPSPLFPARFQCQCPSLPVLLHALAFPRAGLTAAARCSDAVCSCETPEQFGACTRHGPSHALPK